MEFTINNALSAYYAHCKAKYFILPCLDYNKTINLVVVPLDAIAEYVAIDNTASSKNEYTGGKSLRFHQCIHSDKMFRRLAMYTVKTGMTVEQFLAWAKTDARHFDTWEKDGSLHLNRGQAFEHLCYILLKKSDTWKRDNSPHWKRGDIIYKGKSCQIKYNLGTLLTKAEMERW